MNARATAERIAARAQRRRYVFGVVAAGLAALSACVVNVDRDRSLPLRCGAGGRCATGLVCAADGYCRVPSVVDGGVASVDGGADGGCVAKTCAALGVLCGSVDDGCGRALTCPTCESVAGGTVMCVSGRCVSDCGSGQHVCSSRCVANDSPATCGARCEPCPAPTEANATCLGGVCGWACRADRCREGDACVDPASDPRHCGRCDNACATGQSCVNGACRTPRVVLFGGQGDVGPLADLSVLELPTGGAPRWTTLTPTNAGPTARVGARAVHDAPNDRLLLYGGALANGQTTAEVWALSLGANPTWSPLPAGGTPQPRTLAALALDAPSSRLVVSHGQSGTAEDCVATAHELALTSSAAWSDIATTGEPLRAVFNGAAFAHDPVGRRLFVHGGEGHGNADGGVSTGCLPCCPYYSDTHVLSLAPPSEWTRLRPNGTPPEGTGGASMIWDPVGARLVRFGGRTQRAELRDGTHALLLPPGGTPFWLEAVRTLRPAPRGHAAAIYDPQGKRMLVLGGRGATLLADVWALDLSSTTQLGDWAPLTPLGAPPPARERAAVVYLP